MKTKSFRLRIIVAALAALWVGPVEARSSDTVFLKLETLSAFLEPSETKVQFPDGSTFALSCDQYTVERGVVALDDRPVPVVRIRCQRGDLARSGTVIWLHGGPFAAYDLDGGGEQAAFLSLGYEVLVPLYIGSAARELTSADGQISPNMNDAIVELKTVIGWAHKRGDRVVLFGTSYGAFLASTVAPALRRKDKLVLHNPLLLPMREAPPATEAGQVILNGQPVADMGEADRLNLIADTVRSFFAEWYDRNVVSVLKAQPPKHLFVVYGDQDTRVGLDRMADLLDLATEPTLVLKDSDHESIASRSDLDAFIAQVR